MGGGYKLVRLEQLQSSPQWQWWWETNASQRAPDIRPAVAWGGLDSDNSSEKLTWWQYGWWPGVNLEQVGGGGLVLSTAWSAWPYVPPGLPRLSQTPASAVRVMQPVITLLPPSVFGICICICLADKGESILSKGLCACSRNIEWEKWLFALCSKYIHWCMGFPQLFYCFFTAGYPLETIDPCPLVNIYLNTHTQTE